MKKFTILSLSLFATAIFSLTSCEITDCKNCEVVQYNVNTGTEISRQAAVEYCGEALDDVENTPEDITGNTRTVWECY